MNILIIDDHALFREGLRLLLSGLSDELVFHEANGVGQLDDDIVTNAKLILLDLTTSDSTGVGSLSTIRAMNPAGSIVVISGENDPEVIRHCIDHGASGYIPKSSHPPVLIAALKLILAGGIYLPPECFVGGESEKRDNVSGVEALTRRQCHALLLAARGQANKSIAREMNISEGTVKLHLSAAYRALGVGNRTEAVFLLSESGLTDADLPMNNEIGNA
ncbi:MAG: LuxR C-terminal-related transcriptional regulator [Granulosicoccus sp.]